SGVILSLEKTAVEKREFLRRWGVYGLVAFVWIPGIGAGVFVAAALGIISRIPLRRLIVALAVGAVMVDGFWAIGLYYTSNLIPHEGLLRFIPLALVLALAALAVVSGVMQRRKRHLFPIVKVQILRKEHV